MTDRTIADQVDEFNIGFNEQIGPRLAAVFAGEQDDLTTAGTPAGVIAVGDALPDAHLVTAAGGAVTLIDALDGRPAVIVFYRGAWCPYCNITLRAYQQDLLPALRERGVDLVAISPQTPEGSTTSIGNGELEFTVLSDPATTLIRALGIATEPSAAAQAAHTDLGFAVADFNADATPAIPYPTVLVVDGGGIVRFVDVHVDYTTRTEVADVLTAVDALAVPAGA